MRCCSLCKRMAGMAQPAFECSNGYCPCHKEEVQEKRDVAFVRTMKPRMPEGFAQESRGGDAFASRFAKWFPRKDWLTEKRVRFFMESERTLALQEAAKVLRDLEKSTSDTLSEDSAYYGYCDYCKDHVSQHGNETNMCGCDFYNQALEDAAREIEFLDHGK